MTFILVSWKSRGKKKDPYKASFLDLSIEAHDMTLFSIYINCMPYMDSNTPSKNIMPQLLPKFYVLSGQKQTHVN